MLNVALIGVGAMGRGHLENLVRLTDEGKLIRLVAICDARQERKEETDFFNTKIGKSEIDISRFGNISNKGLITGVKVGYIFISKHAADCRNKKYACCNNGLLVF